MKGVLIVSHGSRQKSTEQTLKSVVDMTKAKMPETVIETAFMEFNEPNIPDGLKALIKRGANEIAVVPYFLFDGVHIREDIPEVISEFKAEHPDIKIALGKPLGVDGRLSEILFDRVRECL